VTNSSELLAGFSFFTLSLFAYSFDPMQNWNKGSFDPLLKLLKDHYVLNSFVSIFFSQA